MQVIFKNVKTLELLILWALNILWLLIFYHQFKGHSKALEMVNYFSRNRAINLIIFFIQFYCPRLKVMSLKHETFAMSPDTKYFNNNFSLEFSFAALTTTLVRGGGHVVSVLAFYSDNPSSNPTEAYSFFCKFFVWKKENEQKEAVYWMDIFSHLFVVKIVMIVWNDVNKWKRGRDGPFKKPNSWNSLSETGSKELIVRATLGSISVKIEKRRTKQGKRRRDNKTFHYWYDLSIKIKVFTLLTTQLLSNRFWQGC